MHIWVILGNMFSKLVFMPSDPCDHLVSVITGASLKGILCPETFVSKSTFLWRYLWNTNVDLQGAAVSDEAFKNLDVFQILIYMIINTDLLQIYQSV